MINKALVLSTIAMVSISQTQAAFTLCHEADQACSGYYYEDINTAFMDCFDQEGVLLSRKEQFFTTDLKKDCKSSSLSDFNMSMGANSTLPSTLSDDISPVNSTSPMPVNQTVNYCDYFEIGVGYVFTQADQDIGLVVLVDR